MNHTKIIAIQTLSQGSMLLSIQRLLGLEFVMNTKILFDNSLVFVNLAMESLVRKGLSEFGYSSIMTCMEGSFCNFWGKILSRASKYGKRII